MGDCGEEKAEAADCDHEASLTHGLSLRDMPEEILEHILGFLSPYKDLESAKLVSKQWHRLVQSAAHHKKKKFYSSLFQGEVTWCRVSKKRSPSFSEKGHIGISDRFSHSAVYLDGSMYVFGGCTATNTTFNDLWRFDLTTRQWIRPVAMGTYPSPKACATMVVYNGKLVLFGGWSHALSYPPYQTAPYFCELHVYNPSTNHWANIISLGQEPDSLGGHSASVAGHLMVVFGGSPRLGQGTNNLWVFNFVTATWKLQPVARGDKPEPRYGQFQTTLDDSHILIMGGCVGQNRVFNDFWMLTLHPNEPWVWAKLKVEHPEFVAPHTWCHSACKVDNMIVVIAKASKQRHTRNIKRATHRRLPESDKPKGDRPDHNDNKGPQPQAVRVSPSASSSSSSSSLSSSPATQHLQQEPCHQQPQQLCRSPSQAEKVSVAAASPQDDSHHFLQPGSQESATRSQTTTQKLLALQRKLHRDCVSLPDPDNHHHRPRHSRGCSDSDEDDVQVEGHFHRLNNKFGQRQESSSCPPHSRPFSHTPSSSATSTLSSASESVGPSHTFYSSASSPPSQFSPKTNIETLRTEASSSTVSTSASGASHLEKGARSEEPESSQCLGAVADSSPDGASSLSTLKSDDQRVPDDAETSVCLGSIKKPVHEHNMELMQSAERGPSQPGEEVLVTALSFQISPTLHSGNDTAASQENGLVQSSQLPPSALRHHNDIELEHVADKDISQQIPSVEASPPPQALPSTHDASKSSRPFCPPSPPSPSRHHDFNANPDQPQYGSLQRHPAASHIQGVSYRPSPAAASPNLPSQPSHPRHPMPSIRPNATSNRQKQLEALQRQEEILRSKSRALAAARGQSPHKLPLSSPASPGGSSAASDHEPETVPTRNRMDVHVADISRALSDGVVEWRPLTELQPPGAPTETICCSLLEGRGELVLFGGVVRDPTSPAMTHVAISQLFLLQPT